MLERWHALQRVMAEEVMPSPGGPLRVLVVSPVRNNARTVQDFKDNMRALAATNSDGDHFDYALFHYEGSDSHWMAWPGYNDTSIVIKSVGLGCKAQFWAQVSPSRAENYDYIWLLDGDLRLDFFSWDLYRAWLFKLAPLISQPSILPREPGERSSDHEDLRMWQDPEKPFAMALEVNRSEVMAPILSARLWGAVHARLVAGDLRSSWYFSDYWDALALAARNAGGSAGILLVNAAPVRHMNCHDLFSGPSHCTTGCGHGKANCHAVSAAEASIAARSLRGVCSAVVLREALRSGGCRDGAGGRTAIADRFKRYEDKYLARGGDLEVGTMTLEDAQARCTELPGCSGFTFSTLPQRRTLDGDRQGGSTLVSNVSSAAALISPPVNLEQGVPQKIKVYLKSDWSPWQVVRPGSWVSYRHLGTFPDMRFCQRSLAARGPHRAWLRGGDVVDIAAIYPSATMAPLI